MAQSSGYRNIGYFVNWAIYGRNHHPQDLKVENFTHILYSFADVRPESGEVYLTDTWSDSDIHYPGDSWNDVGTNLYGNLKQFSLLKQKNRNLKVLLSIGGWTYSANFKQPASTIAGRNMFAKSAVDLLLNYGFDGIDIDWEYPTSPAEAQDYVQLLKAVRQALDAYGATLPQKHHFELTVACPAGPKNYQMMDIKGMDASLDFWNLMAYDYAGGWQSIAGHQANLLPSTSTPAATPFNTNQAIQYYKSQGVAASKIVLGMPLYGRAFENTDGPGKLYTGTGPGSWEVGVYDYKVLPFAGSSEKYDAEAHASYSYDPAARKMVSYDTKAMVTEKAEWIKKNGLGGGMWWETSGDGVGAKSLVQTVATSLGSLMKSDNCINYPHSKFVNLRNQFKGQALNVVTRPARL